MKVSNEYRRQKFLDSYIVIPVGEKVWDQNAMLILSECSMEVWMLLTEGVDLNEIAVQIMKKFDLNREAADKRIDGFLKLLRRRGLLIE